MDFMATFLEFECTSLFDDQTYRISECLARLFFLISDDLKHLSFVSS